MWRVAIKSLRQAAPRLAAEPPVTVSINSLASDTQIRVPGAAGRQQAAGGVPDARAGGLCGVRLWRLLRHID